MERSFLSLPSWALLTRVRNYVFLLMGCVLQSAGAYAQSGGKITGRVIDAERKPLPYVTVLLLKAADSSIVKNELSDSTGSFEITAAAGSYLLHYTSVGYSEGFTSAINLAEGQTLDIPPTVMKGSATTLKDITVVARKPMIEIKADRTVFNIENSINATGSNALELLRKSPGVQVDNNENISMRGKNGVKIYIDGRLSQLSATSLAAYLKSINSNDIEAIEMISNPSAKYDASGNAGIINIRLKKNKKIGTNGSINAGLVQGVSLKENGSVNLNYRDKKINVFGNLSGNTGKYHNDQNLYRISNGTIIDPHTQQINDARNVNLKAGVDYFMDRRSTIGMMVTTSYSDGPWSSTGMTRIKDQATDTFQKILLADNRIAGTTSNSNLNFNYRFADTNGMEFNIDANYGRFVSDKTSRQPNYYFFSDQATDQADDSTINKAVTPVNIDIYTLNADGEQNFAKGKLGYGFKTAFVRTKNTFDFYDVLGTSEELVTGRSNDFEYTENVNALYVNYQRQFNPHWSLQAGARAEQTNSEGELTRRDGISQPDNDVKRSYLDFFPSGALTWTMSEKHTLNFTYSRRIDRPTYEDLNPFETKLDELTYSKGNAFLRPQYTDNVELTYTLMGMVNATAGYSHVKDFAVQALDTTSGNATYVQQQNLATQEIFNFAINSPLPIRKWWNGYVSIWANYQKYKGSLTGRQLTLDIPTYGIYMQHSFSLGKDYTAEVSGWFNGPGIWGATGKTRPQGSMDIGLQKRLLNKRLTIKIAATDILATASPWHIKSDFSGLYINGNGTWESRTLRLSLSYQFGSAQIRSARQRKTGLEEESRRLKG